MVRGRRDESGVLGACGARAPRGDDHAQRGARGRAWTAWGASRRVRLARRAGAPCGTLVAQRKTPRQGRGVARWV